MAEGLPDSVTPVAATFSVDDLTVEKLGEIFTDFIEKLAMK
jgi:hypothetical protein